MSEQEEDNDLDIVSPSSSDEEESEKESSDVDDLGEDADDENMDNELDDIEPTELQDEDPTFEGKTKSTQRKCIKKKLFPFLKKRKKVIVEIRDPPEYIEMENMRGASRSLLLSIDKERHLALEKCIYNCAVRQSKKSIVDTWCAEESTIVRFKHVYMIILSQVIGSYIDQIDPSKIMNELNENKYAWDSSLFFEAETKERLEIEKIKNPESLQHFPRYPCGKCGGIWHLMERNKQEAQMRDSRLNSGVEIKNVNITG